MSAPLKQRHLEHVLEESIVWSTMESLNDRLIKPSHRRALAKITVGQMADLITRRLAARLPANPIENNEPMRLERDRLELVFIETVLRLVQIEIDTEPSISSDPVLHALFDAEIATRLWAIGAPPKGEA